MGGSTAGVGKNFTDRDRGEFGAEMDDFGGEIGWISWMESGETWGDARSTRNQENPHIKIKKISSKTTNHKKLWGPFLVGFFGFRTKSTK